MNSRSTIAAIDLVTHSRGKGAGVFAEAAGGIDSSIHLNLVRGVQTMVDAVKQRKLFSTKCTARKINNLPPPHVISNRNGRPQNPRSSRALIVSPFRVVMGNMYSGPSAAWTSHTHHMRSLYLTKSEYVVAKLFYL
jgi:hypothetical protein